MNIDVERHLGSVERRVASLERDGKPARAVTLSRTYDTTVDDLWDALTNAERLPRWFLPVSGDLEPGGRYQLEGNAGGSITACDPPSHLALTWEMHGDVSWVEVRLAVEDGDRALLTLTHTAYVSDHWETYGPGAVGVGWDLGLLGLALHIANPDLEKVADENEFAASPEGKAFIVGSSDDWCRAAIAFGTDAGEAHEAAERTRAFYTGEGAPGD